MPWALSSTSRLDWLPDSLLGAVLGATGPGPEGVAAAARTSRRLRDAAAGDAVWASLFRSRWGGARLQAELAAASGPGGARDAYRKWHGVARWVADAVAAMGGENAQLQRHAPLVRIEAAVELAREEDAALSGTGAASGAAVERVLGALRGLREATSEAGDLEGFHNAGVALCCARREDARLGLADLLAREGRGEGGAWALEEAALRFQAGFDPRGGPTLAQLQAYVAALVGEVRAFLGRTSPSSVPADGTGRMARAATECMVRPRAEGGLGFEGDTGDYYHVRNSLLGDVALNRRGIPLTLGILHRSVLRGLGVAVDLVGFPRNVLTRFWDEDADPPAYAYVDVFGGGRTMDREACVALARSFGLGSGAGTESWFAPMGLRDVVKRMGANMVYVSTQQTQGFNAEALTVAARTGGLWWEEPSEVKDDAEETLRDACTAWREHGALPVRLHAYSVLVLAYETDDHLDADKWRICAAKSRAESGDYERALSAISEIVARNERLAGGPLPSSPPSRIPSEPGLPNLNRVLARQCKELSRQIVERKAAQRRECLVIKRRDAMGFADGRELRLHVGQVVLHKLYGYRGVIVGWDSSCKAREQWILQMGVDQLPGGRHQPFYNVLVDVRDRPGAQTTYAAQENLQVLIGPEGFVESVPDFGGTVGPLHDILALSNLMAQGAKLKAFAECEASQGHPLISPFVGLSFKAWSPALGVYVANKAVARTYPQL